MPTPTHRNTPRVPRAYLDPVDNPADALAIIALALAWGYRAHDLKIIQASSAQRISASQPAAAPRPREATTNYLP